MTFMLNLLGFFGLYQLIDVGRLVKRRLHPAYRRRAFWKTLGWLLLIQAAVVLTTWLIKAANISGSAAFYLLAGGQLLSSLIIFASVSRHLRTTKPPALTANYVSQDLPTLSVCIPARNETNDLEACLASLVASDYPKLEILVLDDSSQTRKTPEIIRSFAQSGVRFLAGKEPPARWLAKNYAYRQLAEAASGELLLFCGVDTRFQPQTLSLLVKLMLQKNKSMLGVLPHNLLPGQASAIRSLLIQPGRYAWELSLPRRMLGRPPVLSTCWLIRHETLSGAGGFAAVSHKAVPESYLARYAAGHNDGYGFMQADGNIGLTNLKGFDEQLSTAIRTRYPQLHRRPEITALVSLAELYVLVLPFSFLLAALFTGWWPLVAISSVSCLLLSWHFVAIVGLTYRRFMWQALFMLPFAALYDIGLLNYSMCRYEFGQVLWKDRDITGPVMRDSL
jgi:glycosyltransferase involved in cell wall biosynthesis